MTAQMTSAHGRMTLLPSLMNFKLSLRRFGCATVIVIGMTACSSSKTPKRNEFGPTYRERMSAAESAMKSGDSAMRSSFENEIPDSTTGKTYKAAAYNAKEATGLNHFSGANSAHQTKKFAEHGKRNSIESRKMNETEAKNKLAARMFRTPDSSIDTKAADADNKKFTQGVEAYKTQDNQAGTREIEKNKKPVILEPDKPTYSEDDVKRLLNKS